MNKESQSVITVTETINCRGHENIRSEHKSTFEITKERHLTEKGTCIIAVSADKGAADLSDEFKKILSDNRSLLKTTLKIREHEFTILSCGSSKMKFNHPNDLVWRRSNFVCPRTVGIYSDCSAVSIPEDIINILKTGEKMTVIMEASFNSEAPSPSAPPLREFFHSFEEC